MSQTLKRAVKAVLATPPAWALSRPLREPGVAVLMYHRVGAPDEPLRHQDAGEFRAQMEWLARHCDPIAPEELRQRCEGGGAAPRRAVLVTFDDGYRGYADHAYPVLKRLGIPALVFLSTDPLDHPGRLLWFDRVELSVHLANRRRVIAPWPPKADYDFGDPDGKRGFVRSFKEFAKSVADEERLACVRRVMELLDIGDVGRLVPRQMLLWDEVRSLSDITRWGGHTVTHPILSRLPDTALEEEVRLSSVRIREETGTPPRSFAYPNGRSIDFDARARSALVRHGFEVAFTTESGLNGPDTDWLAVRRFAADTSTAQMAWRVGGYRLPRRLAENGR